MLLCSRVPSSVFSVPRPAWLGGWAAIGWPKIALWALIAALILVLAVARTALAASPPARPSARIADVIDGDTVVLERAIDGAREVRLVGLQAPKLPLSRPGFKTWPLADEARAALAAIAQNREVTLIRTGQGVDRHRRLLAHLERSDGLWLQGEMLRTGFARVYTFADNRGRAREMFSLEREARAARRGIWRHPFYAIRKADAIEAADIGTFQLVQGTVRKAARVKNHVYLNFGADWRTDFTISIAARDLKLFEQAGLDLLALEGRTVRVRGWLDSYNGPAIEADHPEQIEVLERPDG